MARYVCCGEGCGEDMTSAVLREMFSGGDVEVRMLEPGRERLLYPVTLTCPKGHVCTYDPPTAKEDERRA